MVDLKNSDAKNGIELYFFLLEQEQLHLIGNFCLSTM